MRLTISLFSLFLLFPYNAEGQPKKSRIVTLGDSITRGVRPGVKAEATFAAVLENGLSEKGFPVEVMNVGIGGERTDQALKRLARAVIPLKPRVVTIMYGTNDSYVDAGKKESRLPVETYRANLLTLVRELRKAEIEPILMTPPCWGEKAKNGLGENPNVRLKEYAEACRSVAREEKVPLVDHFQSWTQAKEKGIDVGAWTTDQCHPNAKGHEEIARLTRPVLEAVLASPSK